MIVWSELKLSETMKSIRINDERYYRQYISERK